MGIPGVLILMCISQLGVIHLEDWAQEVKNKIETDYQSEILTGFAKSYKKVKPRQASSCKTVRQKYFLTMFFTVCLCKAFLVKVKEAKRTKLCQNIVSLYCMSYGCLPLENQTDF